MVSFLTPFPVISSNHAFKLFNLILTKTRFVSHIHFIGRCLHAKVIPVGFRANFHPSNFGVNSAQYFSDVSTASTSYSRSIMRSTIRAMCSKRDSLTRDIDVCLNNLSNVCPAVLVSSIRYHIHSLNSRLYESLRTSKLRKFTSLVGVNHHSLTHSNHVVSRHSVVTIPEDLPLSDSEISVLSKGLNFVPVAKKSDEFQTKKDAESYFRRTRLKAFFSDSTQSRDRDVFERLNPRKSNWVPPEGQFASLDLFINKCRRDISNLNFNRKLNYSNLSKDEWTALRRLRNRSDIVIKPADKGGAVVVWRTDLYKQEALRQLSDTNFYCEVDKDLTLDNQKLVKETVNSFISEGSLPSTATNLFVTTPRTSHIYFLPKIHKANNPGRPIVSACSCPTELISSYLDSLMLPIVQSLPTYVKDTNHALTIFNDFRFPNNSSKLLFTMDVKSLYTVIPNDEGLRALQHFFDLRPVLEPSTPTLLRLAELVLTLNCFSFGDRYFKQINGVAMGTKMGPSYANLFVGYIENLIFQQYTGPKPEFFGRYIDDCIGATSCSREDLDSFISYVNSFHPSLEFTWEISETSVTFLDISVSIVDDHLSTSVHYKPTDSHSYLLYSSSHPKHTLNAIPFSQFLRLRRLCSDDDDFSNKCSEMRSFFLSRNYPSHVIDQAILKVSTIDRNTALTPNTRASDTERIPFTLTYHPRNNSIKPIVHRNFSLLESDTNTSRIFNARPLFSYKRDRNLRSFLVKGVLPSDKEPGTFRCSRNRCNTCPYIVSHTSIAGPKSSVRITDHFQCTTSNVIYCIKCSRCNLLYVGETGRRLGDRIREHLHDVRTNDQTKPVSRHFNLPNHSLSDFIVFGLSLVTGDNDCRKTKEMRLIHVLGTHSPNGINERFAFN